MVGIVGLGYCQHLRPSLPHPFPFTITNINSNIDEKRSLRVGIRRRKTILLGAAASLLSLLINSSSSSFAQELDEQEESTVVRLFQETSPSVVFIQVLEKPKNSKDTFVADATTKVEGTGSGFLWDNFGHIVTNYHVVANLATDNSGLRFCKVTVVDAQGNKISTEAQIIGFDQTYDLAVLEFDSQGKEFNPALIGTSRGLRVGQNCFAIGNPYGYENTLTTGVVSGLGREIPSPNGQAIRGAIQTDASINAGNSGGPLIDSYGHVIGVNTATFTRKGTGMSSGVNFAIPIDTVLRTVPSLIVYGTPYSNRY